MTVPNNTVAIATSVAPRRGAFVRILRNPIGVTAIVVIITIAIFGLLAPWLAPFNPGTPRLELTNAPPFGAEYFLGGDHNGRDILSRLMYATGGTIQASVVMLAVSLILGVTTGLIAGYFGGVLDDVSDWISSLILALPGFVLLIALYTVIGPNILLAMALYGVLVAPSFFRLTRGIVHGVRKEPFIDAAKVAGLSDGRIMGRHVLRAVRGPVIVQASFVLAAGISIQAGLEFLGLGDRQKPSWGGMLQDAFNNIYVNPVAVLWPALLIGIATLALVMLGSVVRDALQPASQGRTRRHERALSPKREAAAQNLHASGLDDGNDVALRIRDLSIGYPTSAEDIRTVVHGVDLDVARGEIHGLVGESGSGKSQVAFSTLGILPPEAIVETGRIELDGADLIASRDALKAARGKRIAYIPQEPMSNLDPTFTIGQQLTYGLRAVSSIDKRGAKTELVALLSRVGIRNADAVFDMYPHQISGGMAQRVLIAGAIAGNPEVLIADEPTTALDVTVQADVLELLRELQKERNLAMLLITHNLGVVADICDRVSVMKDGRIVETNTVEGLFEDPQHDYTRALLGSTMEGAPLRAPITTGGANVLA